MAGKGSLFQYVRNGLRLATRRGFCPYCGAEDPDDDGHNPMCGIGEAFDALAKIEAEFNYGI